MITPATTQFERMTLVAYIASKIGMSPAQMVGTVPYEILGIHHGDKLMGAVLLINRRRHSVEMSWAGEPGWLTPGDIRRIWTYAFETLGVLTVLGTIREKNFLSREIAERMGCELVGIIPDTFGEAEAGALYCMRRATCRWLRPASIMNGAAHG